MNKVQLIGEVAYLTKATTKTGKLVAHFKMICTQGNRKEFVPCMAWEEQAAAIVSIEAGRSKRAKLSGFVHVDAYEKNGEKRRTVEVMAESVEPIEEEGEVQ